MVRDMNDSKSSVVYKTIFSFYNISNLTVTLSLIDYWLLVTEYLAKIELAMWNRDRYGPRVPGTSPSTGGARTTTPEGRTRWVRPLAYQEDNSLETDLRGNSTLPPPALKLTPKTNQRSHFPCFPLSRFFYAGLVQIRSHPDHWRMRVGTQPPGDDFSAVGMWMTRTYLYAKYVVIL